MGGEHRQPRILQRDQAHQHVAVVTLAADLLGVDPRGLVAMMAVGDQQLGVLQRRLGGGDRGGVGDARQPADGAVRRRSSPPQWPDRRRSRARPRRSGPGSEYSEKIGDRLALRGAGQPQPVLLGAGVRALVRADRARAVLLDADAREESLTGAAHAVRVRCSPATASTAPVARPARRRPRRATRRGSGRRCHSDPRHPPAGRSRPRCTASAPASSRPLLVVDHVVGRGDDVVQAAGPLQVVVKRAERLDRRHRSRRLPSRRRRFVTAARRWPLDFRTRGAWRSLVARLLWEQEVPGSNPGAPTFITCKTRVAGPASRRRSPCQPAA